MTEKLLTRREAAEFLRLRYETLGHWAHDGINLPYVQCGRRIRYRLSDLENFLAGNTIAPAAAAAKK